MNYSNKCEECSISVNMSPEEINMLVEKTIRNKNVKTAPESEYIKRMNICMGCESLMFNTTCRHCGCIIHIKAILENAVCPYPYEPKW